MKVATATTLALLFVGALTHSDYPVPYQVFEDDDNNTAFVTDENDDLNGASMENVYPYFDVHTAVRFELYTRDNPDVLELLSLNNDSLQGTKYDPNRPTRMFVHGWKAGDIWTPLFTEAYFKKGNFNVNFIAVNWREGADTLNYAAARSRVNRVGSYIAQFIDYLVIRSNLELKDFSLVGHSLGAHVAGFAGKNVASGKIGKIVGLDPALPLFRYSPANARLASTDANYVETIHTNAGMLGFSMPLGHVSFYPNGGTKQPGCGWDMLGNCAHARSLLYYIESVYSSTKYFGVRCKSLCDLQRCHVNDEPIVNEMGAESNEKKTHGIFFFETNSKPVYSLGSQIVHKRR